MSNQTEKDIQFILDCNPINQLVYEAESSQKALAGIKKHGRKARLFTHYYS